MAVVRLVSVSRAMSEMKKLSRDKMLRRIFSLSCIGVPEGCWLVMAGRIK